MNKFTKPTKFDNNIIVIGAGSGGLITAYIAAVVKAQVTLIEKHDMGGDCLNTGCVPSKTLIKSATIAHSIRKAQKYGINVPQPIVDFDAVMQRIKDVIKKIEPHDSVERFTSLGVNVIKGEAKIKSPWEVAVNGQTFTTKNIVIATGATPFIPPISGIEKITPLTSENIWNLTALPKKFVCLGGGPIGSEICQSFARLGSEVYQIEKGKYLLSREDEQVSTFIKEKFITEGINVLTNHTATEVRIEDKRKFLICISAGKEVKIEFDELCVAVGRKANVTNFGLEELGVKLTNNNTIAVSPFLTTNYSNIYAVGDVAGPYQFTHTASHMAWYAAVNSLFGNFKKFKVNYSTVPWATFTDPEVARVGLNELEAKKQNIAYEITEYSFDDLDRAISDGTDEGWITVLTEPNKDKILGVTIVSANAGDLIHEYILAMNNNLGLNKILGTIHIYPTMSEGNKMVAGKWKNEHKPEFIISLLEKFNRFMR